jgi:PAS domain S-box-containing protein
MSNDDLRANILLVDDHPANLLALEAVLQDLGHNLVRAGSGEEALRLLAQQDFAVVLLDVRLPGLDGYDTAKLIRGRERSRHTPIIFLTAHDDNRLPVAEAYSLGAVDYLVKPLIPVILRAKVSGFVDLYQQAVQIQRQAEQLRLLERREFERRLADENSQRRQALEALRESEQRFARFMQHLPGLAWIKDLAGRYVYANDAAVKAFGTSRERLYGKTDEEVFAADVAAQFRENDARALASATGVQVVETLTHDDGVLHSSIVSKFPIPGPDGEPALVGGVAIDITDRLRAEHELREQDRRKDEFLAMLAHELRNPLAPIRNALQILMMPGLPEPERQQTRALIARQVGQLTRLVDDLLDVSRITRGKIALRKVPVALAGVLRRAAETSQPLIEANRHTLTLDIPPEPLWVEADSTRLEQVFTNLLNNAAKYTERGGSIRLSVELASRGQQPPEVLVRVRDTGFGIPAQVLPYIFELFAQADRTLDRAQGGLGIGLTLVKTLVELHGGTVTAHSEGAGQGSEFVVRLPLLKEAGGRMKEEAGQGPASVPPSSFLAPPSNKVLVVDDNRDSADSLALLLRLWGHEARTAHDGLSGLKAARSYRPQVVFLDIGLPGLDGYELARRLREEFGQEMRLIAVTGYGQEEDRRRALEAGCDAHLIKPADPADVQRLLTGP